MNDQLNKLLIDLDDQLKFIDLEQDDPIKSAQLCIDDCLKALTKLLNASVVHGENKHFEILKSQIDEYFKGDRKEFSVPL